MYKHTDVFSLFNDEVEGWLDDDSCIILRAITRNNDSVELTADQAREIAEKLVNLADKLDKLDGFA